MPPGRNEPCSCGSGRKYKHCCDTGRCVRPETATGRSSLGAAPGPAESGRGRVRASCSHASQCLARPLLAAEPKARMRWRRSSRPAAPCRAMLEVHYLLGQALEDHGLLERAAESFGRATALRPEFADAHNDLGQVLLRLGRTDAAIASCQRALALRPHFAAALGNLANAERARGALAAAIEGVPARDRARAGTRRGSPQPRQLRFSRPASREAAIVSLREGD
jgi:hypothetical protein